MFAPQRPGGKVRGPPRLHTPGRRIAAVFGRPDRRHHAVGVGVVGEVAGQHVKDGLLPPSGD